MSVLETNNLTKYYGKERGIVDVSIAIEAGEVYGFIGPNGAGKSTTIRTVLGLLRPTSGLVSLFGQNALEKGPDLRKKIGHLPTKITLKKCNLLDCKLFLPGRIITLSD